jgi:methylmalonyl-CoA mutase N-terminal domain/subunit
MLVKAQVIDSVEDMKVLFDQIPLDEMSVSMTTMGQFCPHGILYCGSRARCTTEFLPERSK